MSILETIEAAEQAAAQVRQEATVNARELLRAAEAQAQLEAANRIEQAKEQARMSLMSAEAEAQKQANEHLAQKIAHDEKVAKDARKNLPKAVQTIVERVVKVC